MSSPYDDTVLSFSRRILDALDRAIDKSIIHHDLELELRLEDAKREVFQLQDQRLQQLQQQREAKAS